MSYRELITWIPVEERLPDDDATVLVLSPGSDEPVWLGWHQDDEWYDVTSGGMFDEPVTAWAALPTGDATQ